MDMLRRSRCDLAFGFYLFIWEVEKKKGGGGVLEAGEL